MAGACPVSLRRSCLDGMHAVGLHGIRSALAAQQRVISYVIERPCGHARVVSSGRSLYTHALGRAALPGSEMRLRGRSNQPVQSVDGGVWTGTVRQATGCEQARSGVRGWRWFQGAHGRWQDIRQAGGHARTRQSAHMMDGGTWAPQGPAGTETDDLASERARGSGPGGALFPWQGRDGGPIAHHGS